MTDKNYTFLDSLYELSCEVLNNLNPFTEDKTYGLAGKNFRSTQYYQKNLQRIAKSYNGKTKSFHHIVKFHHNVKPYTLYIPGMLNNDSITRENLSLYGHHFDNFNKIIRLTNELLEDYIAAKKAYEGEVNFKKRYLHRHGNSLFTHDIFAQEHPYYERNLSIQHEKYLRQIDILAKKYTHIATLIESDKIGLLAKQITILSIPFLPEFIQQKFSDELRLIANLNIEEIEKHPNLLQPLSGYQMQSKILKGKSVIFSDELLSKIFIHSFAQHIPPKYFRKIFQTQNDILLTHKINGFSQLQFLNKYSTPKILLGLMINHASDTFPKFMPLKPFHIKTVMKVPEFIFLENLERFNAEKYVQTLKADIIKLLEILKEQKIIVKGISYPSQGHQNYLQHQPTKSLEIKFHGSHGRSITFQTSGDINGRLYFHSHVTALFHVAKLLDMNPKTLLMDLQDNKSNAFETYLTKKHLNKLPAKITENFNLFRKNIKRVWVQYWQQTYDMEKLNQLNHFHKRMSALFQKSLTTFENQIIPTLKIPNSENVIQNMQSLYGEILDEIQNKKEFLQIQEIVHNESYQQNLQEFHKKLIKHNLNYPYELFLSDSINESASYQQGTFNTQQQKFLELYGQSYLNQVEKEISEKAISLIKEKLSQTPKIQNEIRVFYKYEIREWETIQNKASILSNEGVQKIRGIWRKEILNDLRKTIPAKDLRILSTPNWFRTIPKKGLCWVFDLDQVVQPYFLIHQEKVQNKLGKQAAVKLNQYTPNYWIGQFNKSWLGKESIIDYWKK